jgi:carbonic anhydrase/acetyltransferase-like protein (isoleucine patch superfamily)
MALYELNGHRVTVPKSGQYWVAENATLTGKIIIEEDASVWFNTVARGDNEPITIGAGTNVQDGCVLHADPGFPLLIGPEVTVGHMVMLHGCTIGRGALIGIGAIVLNGAKIGEDSMIGAGTLIPEGRKSRRARWCSAHPAKWCARFVQPILSACAPACSSTRTAGRSTHDLASARTDTAAR